MNISEFNNLFDISDLCTIVNQAIFEDEQNIECIAEGRIISYTIKVMTKSRFNHPYDNGPFLETRNNGYPITKTSKALGIIPSLNMLPSDTDGIFHVSKQHRFEIIVKNLPDDAIVDDNLYCLEY